MNISRGLHATRYTLRAFTVLEVLVVVGLTVILMGVLVGYNRSIERHLILFQEQAKVLGILQKAKSLALGAYAPPGVVVCAYGVFFSPSEHKMILFQDLPSPNCKETGTDYKFTASNPSEIMEEVRLDAVAVRFSALLPISQVVYIPPYPTVKIWDVAAANGDLVSELITIELLDGSASRSVRVTDFGQISAE